MNDKLEILNRLINDGHINLKEMLILLDKDHDEQKNDIHTFKVPNTTDWTTTCSY